MDSLKIRPVAVANTFYPGQPEKLRARVNGLLKSQERNARPPLKAMIVPHAGYDYSGATAANAYQVLKAERHRIRRVILLGPCHRVAIDGLALPSVQAFATPLGEISIDTDAVQGIKDMPQVCVSDRAHAQEHSLEVQLPFLRTVLEDFRLVPFVVGRATPQEVAAVLEKLWGGDETLIVISSDLSHYHDDASARRLDAQTIRKIENYAIDLNGQQACGAIPLNGLLLRARICGLDIERCRISNSADTIGPPDRVVGYGAWLLRPAPHGLDLNSDDRQRLLELARTSIRHGLLHEKQPVPVEIGEWPARFRKPGATFVTLKISGNLRGCRGSLQPIRSLAHDVAWNASDTAFRDPRFSPISTAEFAQADLSLSLLEDPVPLPATGLEDLRSKLRPHQDGLLIQAGNHRATFLPSVWEQISDPDKFLEHLWVKATLKPGVWPENMKVWRYAATLVEAGNNEPGATVRKT